MAERHVDAVVDEAVARHRDASAARAVVAGVVEAGALGVLEGAARDAGGDVRGVVALELQAERAGRDRVGVAELAVRDGQVERRRPAAHDAEHVLVRVEEQRVGDGRGAGEADVAATDAGARLAEAHVPVVARPGARGGAVARDLGVLERQRRGRRAEQARVVHVPRHQHVVEREPGGGGGRDSSGRVALDRHVPQHDAGRVVEVRSHGAGRRQGAARAERDRAPAQLRGRAAPRGVGRIGRTVAGDLEGAVRVLDAQAVRPAAGRHARQRHPEGGEAHRTVDVDGAVRRRVDHAGRDVERSVGVRGDDPARARREEADRAQAVGAGAAP